MTRIINNCVALVCLCLFGYQSLKARGYSHSEQIKWGTESILNGEKKALGGFDGGMVGSTSITLPDGVLYIGGRDSSQCSKKVVLTTMQQGKRNISEDWPLLPFPLSNAAGVLLDNKIYVLGGRKSLKPSDLSDSFLVLDLSNKSKGWKELPTYPGDARENAIFVVQNDGVSPCLYVLGGQKETEEGVSSCLTDGYVYNPQLNRWSSLGSGFPKGVCAAIVSGANHILLFQEESEDTLLYRKKNMLWKYHTITRTLIKSELIPCTYDIVQVLQKDRTFFISAMI